jgi:hydrogenase small subunit
MDAQSDNLLTRLQRHQVSRRQFLKFCGLMASALALPQEYGPRVAKALATAPRLPVIWLEFQDCTGDTESFLRASNPTVSTILLETISVNYHETIMAPSGHAAEKSRSDTITQYNGQYVAIVEGAIPTRDGGVYCTIGGRTALDIIAEVCLHALATISVGACAWDGGLSSAQPNPTQAVGVSGALPQITNVINLPGCPMNVINLSAVIIHYLTAGTWPALDSTTRTPLFAYGDLVHNQCERRAHYEAGEFVLSWDDPHHRAGWCLRRMGCRGPATHNNCPTVKWNEGTNWPVAAGHGCVGCGAPHFWDATVPFYWS